MGLLKRGDLMGRFDCINIYVADVVEKAKALDIRQSNLAYHNSTICLLL
jgi:hypothetical protein